ncbi:hypothetical protein RvY_05105 [Ramazzottius varieornatus]|uniref:Enoyl reductase (ER) domain-containing protein n=1 Tax=Ramazzottius varieornatus TaxID=947166 RepID=A0A1D1V3T3_RAMVA|nr:hypothetical protein RvY_05105 [Ramazzottius varieornatus]
MGQRTMKAIRVSELGGPHVLRVEEVPIPKPAQNQVLIEVKSAGVNPVEAQICNGEFGLCNTPFTPGGDTAGIVAAVGEGVTQFKVGDRVYSCYGDAPPQPTGAYGQFMLAETRFVFPLADRLSFSQGAALGVPYFTALRALKYRAKAKAGESILIHGASGAVGIAATQIATALGMTVTGTAGSAEGLALIKLNGATIVSNHKDKDHAENLHKMIGKKGFDVILETNAHKNLALDTELIGQWGRIVAIGGDGATSINARTLLNTEATLTGVQLWKTTSEEWQTMADILAGLIEAGKIAPVIDTEYSLEQASEVSYYCTLINFVLRYFRGKQVYSSAGSSSYSSTLHRCARKDYPQAILKVLVYKRYHREFYWSCLTHVGTKHTQSRCNNTVVENALSKEKKGSTVTRVTDLRFALDLLSRFHFFIRHGATVTDG